MVVTSFPAARDTGVLQERTGRPSRCTVQAPHCATPQPYFVPVKPRCSRKTHSRGVEGSTSTFTLRLFTVREITRCLPGTSSSSFDISKFSAPPAHDPAKKATGADVARSRKRTRSLPPAPRQFLQG